MTRKCIFAGCDLSSTKRIHFHFIGDKGQGPEILGRDFGPLCNEHAYQLSRSLQLKGISLALLKILIEPLEADGYVLEKRIHWTQKSLDRPEEPNFTHEDCIRRSSKASTN